MAFAVKLKTSFCLDLECKTLHYYTNKLLEVSLMHGLVMKRITAAAIQVHKLLSKCNRSYFMYNHSHVMQSL